MVVVRELLGVELDSIWGTLLAASALPAWLTTPPAPFAVRPMDWDAALRIIQSNYKVRGC